MGKPRVKVKNLGTPDLRYRKNVAINYPLDKEDRLEVGGGVLDEILTQMKAMRESNDALLSQICLLNLRFDECFPTGFTELDIEPETDNELN